MHAKGGGAYGKLVITEDISKYTKASVLQKGKTTRMLARFSTVAGVKQVQRMLKEMLEVLRLNFIQKREIGI